MSKGADILMALENAAAGDFVAVTVHGQTWVRKETFEQLRNALNEWVEPYRGRSHGDVAERCDSETLDRIQRSFGALHAAEMELTK